MPFGGSVAQLADLTAKADAQNQQLSQQEVQSLRTALLNEKARREQMAMLQQQHADQLGLSTGYLTLAQQKEAGDFGREARLQKWNDQNYELAVRHQKYLEDQIPKAEQVQTRDLLNLATQEADVGTFNPDAYKTLPAQDKTALLQRRDTVRHNMELQYNQLNDVAQAKNRLQQLKGYVNLSTEAQKDAPSEPGFIRRMLADKNTKGPLALPAATTPTRESIGQNIQDWQAESSGLRSGVDTFEKNKNAFGLLTQDTATGQWKPAQDLPWLRSAPSLTATVTNAPGYAASPTASVAPAPMNPAQRQRGAVYQTPRGPLRWSGTGWIAP